MTSVSLEMRYARSFLVDLKSLEPAAYQRVYDFIFSDFAQKLSLHGLPELRQLDDEGIFHRFTIDNYLVGIEIRGEIVKFLRVIPMPDV
ncbi:asr1049 [Nostoc sp. PCC 7120 = FACHB-418]|nr:asr1049 [Nostoc sp. PCC 7120 = FACHB-418]